MPERASTTGPAEAPRTRRERRLAHTTTAPQILAVCTGNICRSPMAELLLRARLGDLDVRVASAGTHAMVGYQMPAQARRLAEAHGADPAETAQHRARQMIEPMLEQADLTLTMSHEHRALARRLAPGRMRHIVTIREFARLVASMDDDTLRAAADAGGDIPAQRLARATAMVSILRAARTKDDDVVDPYRRSDAIYEQSALELIPAIDQVERFVVTVLR